MSLGIAAGRQKIERLLLVLFRLLFRLAGVIPGKLACQASSSLSGAERRKKTAARIATSPVATDLYQAVHTLEASNLGALRRDGNLHDELAYNAAYFRGNIEEGQRLEQAPVIAFAKASHEHFRKGEFLQAALYGGLATLEAASFVAPFIR